MSEGMLEPIKVTAKRKGKLDETLDAIFEDEGGWQNDVEDLGNRRSDGKFVGTNHGISAKVYEEWTGKPPSISDMKNMTQQEARKIYKRNYVQPVTKNLGIPVESPLFGQALDIVINHGYGNAVPIMQRAAGVPVDGKAGPGTRKAIAEMDSTRMNNSLVDKRKEFYNAVMKSDPSKEKYRNGWMARADSFTKLEPITVTAKRK